jgi:hypothetical protein
MGALLGALADCQAALARERGEREVLARRMEEMERRLGSGQGQVQVPIQAHGPIQMQVGGVDVQEDMFSDDEDGEGEVDGRDVHLPSPEKTVHALLPLEPRQVPSRGRSPAHAHSHGPPPPPAFVPPHAPRMHKRQNSGASSVFVRPPMEMPMLLHERGSCSVLGGPAHGLEGRMEIAELAEMDKAESAFFDHADALTLGELGGLSQIGGLGDLGRLDGPGSFPASSPPRAGTRPRDHSH